MTLFNTVASICSILGLIVAFWQLWEVRKKLSSTQTALSQLRDVFVDQKVDVLLKLVISQQEELIKVISSLSKQGRSDKSIKDTIEKIIIELNKCDNEMPEKHKAISESLENAIKYLQRSLDENDKKESLLEAEGYLKGCIHALKKAVEEGLDQTVDVISKAN